MHHVTTTAPPPPPPLASRMQLLGEELLLLRPIVHEPVGERGVSPRFDVVERCRLDVEAGDYTTPERIATLINRIVG